MPFSYQILRVSGEAKMGMRYQPRKRSESRRLWMTAPSQERSSVRYLQSVQALFKQLTQDYSQTLQQLKSHCKATLAAKDEQISLYRQQQRELYRLTQLSAQQCASAPLQVAPRPGKRVVLKLGRAEESGIPVVLQIGEEGQLPELETTGWLPRPTQLLATLDRWQNAYRQISLQQPVRLQAPAVQVTNVSYQENWQRCLAAEKILVAQLNRWLNSGRFRPVREVLLAALAPTDAVRFVLQTDDMQIRALPLHQWDWFERYPQAELVLSETAYQERSRPTPSSGKVRILAVLGNSEGLDVQRDRTLLSALPNASLTCLVEPTRSQLNEALWEQSWDILFFAGHSTRTAGQQKLRLNATEELALSELKYGLRKACDRGLQLAIFNACDGLELIKTLRDDLAVPSTIIMRHPVSDIVAQTFLKHFLTAFSQGSLLHQAVREARERLQGIESQFPFATWLPVLCQSSSTLPFTWESLSADSSR